MKTAVAKKEIESALANRFGAIFERREKQAAEILPTGVPEIDALLNGFPRGAITEVHGATSSGRTSLLLSALAFATAQEETCALIDCSDTFDPSSAANARVDFDRLLWVRCSGNLERAFKATDLVLQSGGFGLVALNLADLPTKKVLRIISSWWFRFRRALENTPATLVVITPVACIRSCAALVLELKNERVVWPDTVSLVLDNRDARLTIKKDEAQSDRHLSLVAAANQQFESYSSPAHAYLLRQIRVQVNQERPIMWAGEPMRFKASSH
jgi:recA bacterial DNA recombination protein